MTPSEYIAAGYNLSSHIEQARIDKAESLVSQAYIAPMCPTAALLQSEEAKAAKMALAVLFLAKRSMFATRSGAKEKLTAQSSPLNSEKVNEQMVTECFLRLKTLQAKEGARPMTETTDILKIFFLTEFFNL